MDHICHTSCKMSHLSSITLFLQDSEWRNVQHLSFAISCNKSLSFGFFLSLSSASLSSRSICLSVCLSVCFSLACSLGICVSLFVTKLFLQSNSLHVSSFSFCLFSVSLSTSVSAFPFCHLLSSSFFLFLFYSHTHLLILCASCCARVVRERESA